MSSNLNNLTLGVVANGLGRNATFALLLLCCACQFSTQEDGASPSEMEDDEAVLLAFENDPRLSNAIRDESHFGEAPVGWRQPGFVQTYTGVNFVSVEVTDSAQLHTGEWETIRHQSRASFALTDLACGALDEFALLGVNHEKEIVIERWSLKGDRSVRTLDALVAKRFAKKLIFKGARGSKPRGIDMDPSGRFVVYAIQDDRDVTTIFQLDCRDSQAKPVPLANSLAIPALSQVEYVDKFDHATLGRVFVFGTSIEDHHRVLFVDSDDDGVFEDAPIVGDDATLRVLGLGQYENWTSLDH